MSGFERLIELTIRAGSLEPRVDGSPVKSIGWPEVAAAMAFVPVESADLLRAIYLLDEPSAWRVHRRLVEALDRWPNESRFMRERLLTVTMGAFIQLRACRKCGGSGWMVKDKRLLVCGICEGSGLDHVKRSSVQLAMAVDAETWEEQIEKPFTFAYALLVQWHEQGREGLTSALLD